MVHEVGCAMAKVKHETDAQPTPMYLTQRYVTENTPVTIPIQLST